ncbi:hypothetical protein GCM10027290_47120 [Micromonospora sonneratiae]|uniref:Uncharacterized protein n=1 Tax=Micromonospora sonneratiae TaxID=1184706 RepID=A0ABW3YDZ5_9ACTN
MFSGDFEQIPYPVRRPEPDPTTKLKPATEPEPGDAVEPETQPAGDTSPTTHQQEPNRRSIP